MQLILGLFKLLGGLLVLLLRLVLPIAVIVFAIWLIRRGASGGTKHDTGQQKEQDKEGQIQKSHVRPSPLSSFFSCCLPSLASVPSLTSR